MRRNVEDSAPENAQIPEAFKVLAVSVIAHFGYKRDQAHGDFTLHGHTGPCSALDEGSPSLGIPILLRERSSFDSLSNFGLRLFLSNTALTWGGGGTRRKGSFR